MTGTLRTGHILDELMNIARAFPNVVEIPVPAGGLGKRLDEMHGFHWARGTQARLRTGKHDGQDYLCWCFSARATAETFAAEFSGKLLCNS